MLKHNRIFSPCTVNTMVEGFRHTLLVLERYQLPANLMHGNRISVTFGTKEERGGGVKGLESTSTGLFSPPSPVLRRFRCSGCESESLDSGGCCPLTSVFGTARFARSPGQGFQVSFSSICLARAQKEVSRTRLPRVSCPAAPKQYRRRLRKSSLHGLCPSPRSEGPRSMACKGHNLSQGKWRGCAVCAPDRDLKKERVLREGTEK